MEMVDTISSEQSICGDQFFLNSHLIAEQNIDIDKLIAGLPKELRETCELMRIYTIAEAVKATGLSQSTLFARVKRLYKYMQKQGVNIISDR